MENQLLNPEQLEVMKTEIFPNLTNECVVECILVWDNNPFIKEQMRTKLLQDSKEANIKRLTNKLSERYDRYVTSYMTFLHIHKNKLIKINDNLQDIVQDVFEEFKLTNDMSKPELNRSQIEEINSDRDLKKAIYDYIDQRLVEHAVDDEDIELLIPTIFAAVMVEMLYIQSSPPDINTLNYFLGK